MINGERERGREGGRERGRERQYGDEDSHGRITYLFVWRESKRPWHHSNPLRVGSKCGMIDTECVVMNDPKMASRPWSTMAMEDAGAKWMAGSKLKKKETQSNNVIPGVRGVDKGFCKNSFEV
jgi:hypothetical protein